MKVINCVHFLSPQLVNFTFACFQFEYFFKIDKQFKFLQCWKGLLVFFFYSVKNYNVVKIIISTLFLSTHNVQNDAIKNSVMWWSNIRNSNWIAGNVGTCSDRNILQELMVKSSWCTSTERQIMKCHTVMQRTCFDIRTGFFLIKVDLQDKIQPLQTLNIYFFFNIIFCLSSLGLYNHNIQHVTGYFIIIMNLLYMYVSAWTIYMPFYALTLLAVVVRGIMFSSVILMKEFFFFTNTHLDSTMKLLEIGGQVQSHLDVTKHIFNYSILLMH